MNAKEKLFFDSVVNIEQVKLNLQSLNSVFSIYFNNDLDKDEIDGLMSMGWQMFADTQNAIEQAHKDLLDYKGENML